MSLDLLRAVALMPELGSAWALAFVLGGMANRDGLLWPSIPYLSVRTGLSKGRVKCHMRKLRAAGLLIDTGARKGKSGRIVVYRLHLPPLAALQTEMERRFAEARTSDDADSPSNGIENAPFECDGMVSKTVPLHGSNGVVCDSSIGSFPAQQSDRLRHPESVKESVKESGGIGSTNTANSVPQLSLANGSRGTAKSREAVKKMRLHCKGVK
ncbi:hypothetical protein VSR34_09660 [Paraburkholderia sp. JHI2823]|uniref:hypothetical protein n=1 Tax=Paraburkholderia sp. JHI2823 TaxID=3112960 RepID=UPI00316EF924